MRTVRSVRELREMLAPERTKGRSIGLVPTMGAFHDGHLSLIRRARSECEVVVVSLFVNPRQFGPAEDLGSYPRDDARDLALAEAERVDVLFAPPVDEVYPEAFDTTVTVGGLTSVLDGDPARRGPGHFAGVTTVVTKLFNMVAPDVAYFGQKDAQQALAVKKLVHDLDIPVRIQVCPIVRDPDGLALSSRNAYLDSEDRRRALGLSRALRAAEETVASGTRDGDAVLAAAQAELDQAGIVPEYLELRSASDLSEVDGVDGPTLLAVAARVGKARLIDNAVLGDNETSKESNDMSGRPGANAPPAKRAAVTLSTLAEKRTLGEPIVMVTAYDYPSARVAESAKVDVALVGDSGAMTVLGYPSTVPVTLDELLTLAAAVRRGLSTPLLVGDMPFGSYEASNEEAIHNAQRFVKEAGCDAVKLERGGTSVERARAIIAAGIPVMGHVGLTPQTATTLGGYRSQGRTAERALSVTHDAMALQAAGCFAIVFEAIPSALTEAIMSRMRVPVVGIGAGPATDGQVLVFHDILGIHDGHAARFVKRYAGVREEMIKGVAAFADDVRARRYPAPEHGYTMAPDEIERLHELLEEQTGEPFTGGFSL
jgi:3-methyl-2-oxobutanoate hydroxymethyltransferase